MKFPSELIILIQAVSENELNAIQQYGVSRVG
jgi:hypothetical protein